MKAFVFSIGEKTTDLCVELMKSYGFEVILYQDQTSLWEKLKRFYTEALETDDSHFVRIDADVIPLTNPIKMHNYYGWTCASGFDWYKLNDGAISIHKIDRNIIGLCLDKIELAKNQNRPESYLWRLPEVNKYTEVEETRVWGIHGYGQTDQRDRIKKLKASRDQKYDWELVEKIEAL